jgi:ribonuclease HII
MEAVAATRLFQFDMEVCGSGQATGADEAGRGCLAGPIVAAAVSFDYSLYDSGCFEPLAEHLDDSKKLSPGRREDLFPHILRVASQVVVIQASNHTIDREGLHRTNLRLLSDCLKRAASGDGRLMVDGRQELPECGLPHIPVKGGDARSACIAAASVIAKVTRDTVMRRLHEHYPDYGFDRHVGYATAVHKEAIAIFGLSPVHRRSFRITLQQK